MVVRLRALRTHGRVAGDGLLRALLVALLVGQGGCALADRISGEGARRELRRTGRPAQALVLRIWDTGIKVNDDPIVGFALEVHREGHEPYATETTARIPLLAIPRIQPGQHLPVKYDPRDPRQVALDIYAGDY